MSPAAPSAAGSKSLPGATPPSLLDTYASLPDGPPSDLLVRGSESPAAAELRYRRERNASPYGLPPLPVAAEGHVAGRYAAHQAYDRAEASLRAPHIPPTQEEPIDTYPGSTWLGTGCFAILGAALLASAIVAIYRWIGEVTQ